MITLVGRWEKGWLPYRVEYFMWKQLAASYAVDRIVMVGKSGEPRIPIDQYDTMEEALDSCTGVITLLEPKGQTFLSDYIHPDDAVYVFGDAMNNNLKHGSNTVRIDTPTDTDMFAINAAAIVLSDRYGNRQ